MTEKSTEMYIIKGISKNCENEWVIPKDNIEEFIENCYKELKRGNISFTYVIINYYEQLMEDHIKIRDNIEKLMASTGIRTMEQKYEIDYHIVKETKYNNKATKIYNYLQQIAQNKQDKRNMEAITQIEMIKRIRLRRQLEDDRVREKKEKERNVRLMQDNSTFKNDSLNYIRLSDINKDFPFSEEKSAFILDD